ncbi:MAG: hypothetical protein JXB32_11240, partial [Deltaproteobacteria bacterium]|nr:hypothetical protein [Deltaproteobacteria bacterium]
MFPVDHGRPRPLPLFLLPVLWLGPAVATALPPPDESSDDRPALAAEEPAEGEEADDPQESGPLEERTTADGQDDDAPTRAEARLVEQLSLGTPAIVHRLTAPGG